jgi:hypothetical protein
LLDNPGSTPQLNINHFLIGDIPMRVNHQQQNLNANDNDETQLADLKPIDEVLDAIKGGENTTPERPPGGFINNHNQTIVSDEEDKAQLADLRLPDEKLNSIKGGDGVCHGTTVLAWARVDGVNPLR